LTAEISRQDSPGWGEVGSCFGKTKTGKSPEPGRLQACRCSARGKANAGAIRLKEKNRYVNINDAMVAEAFPVYYRQY